MISPALSRFASAPQLFSLPSLLASQLEAVNECILKKLQNPVALIPEIGGYLISLGGKRLRPLLALASAEMCGYTGTRHINLAACIEFIHTATLLHDDVVDESFLRRGSPSANAKWDNKASVLVGDFLFSKSFELMVQDGCPDVLKLLSDASRTIVEGEVMQLSASHDLRLTGETYLQIIEAKTACLFSAATHVGALVAGASQEQLEHLSQFGRLLGRGFQLMDDILDYMADQAKLGKAVGDDFREGKVTFPVIIAYQNPAHRAFWEAAFRDGNRNDAMLQKAIDLLQESGAIDHTRQMAEDFVTQALAHLAPFPDSSLKAGLEELACFSLRREK